jgi:hypothetical protein
MTTEIDIHDPDVTSAPFTWKTIHAIANTDFVPRALRGNTAAILAAVLTGRELGMGPMEALRTIDVIDGKPSPSAEWMVGKVFEAGHVIVAVEQTADHCTVEGRRFRDGEQVAEMRFTFTMDMAKRASLANKNNWKHYPEAMLYWRATSQLCRQFFPDVLSGLKYLPEELGSETWHEDPKITFTTPDPVIEGTATITHVDPETGEVEEIPILQGQEALEYEDDDPERPFE